MKTEQLIELLSNDRLLRRRLGSALVVAAAAGTFLAATLFFTEIGFRPDIAEAVHSIRFLFKFVVTISLAAAAIVVTMKDRAPRWQLELQGRSSSSCARSSGVCHGD